MGLEVLHSIATVYSKTLQVSKDVIKLAICGNRFLSGRTVALIARAGLGCSQALSVVCRWVIRGHEARRQRTGAAAGRTLAHTARQLRALLAVVSGPGVGTRCHGCVQTERQRDGADSLTYGQLNRWADG